MSSANPIQDLINALEELDQQVGGDPSFLDEVGQIERILEAARPLIVKLCGPNPKLRIFTVRAHNLQCFVGKDGILHRWHPGTPICTISPWAAINEFGFARIVDGLTRTIRREVKKSKRNGKVAAGALRDIRSASQIAAGH